VKGVAKGKETKMADKVLQRTMFETSRALEYFTERELSYQTGHSKEYWPLVILKELMDNAMDACENASVAPEIKVTLRNEAKFFIISVDDNGPGIKPEVVTRILNFLTRTSDKEAYVSPTRGAQGNALKTIFAIPYVLSTDNPPYGISEIESCGIHHTVRVKLDAIKQEPKIEHEQAEIVKKPGCKVTTRLENRSILENFEKERFLQILEDYHLFNPHLTLTFESNLQERGEDKLIGASVAGAGSEPTYVNIRRHYKTTDPSWQKWRPSDFTSPLWYSPDDLKKLILSHVALAQDGGKDFTLREFVSQFRGLTSTSKQKEVTSRLPKIKRLSDFVTNGDANTDLIGQLLLHMQSLTKPVPPEKLGVIGEDHFKKVFGGKDLKYSRKMGTDNGIPFVVEVAYALDDTLEGVKFHFGLNFAPAGSDPLQDYRLSRETKRETFEGHGIKGLCAQYKVSSWDKVHVVCHMTYPRFRFKDRGKTILEIGK
jgi:hypothetical protein